MQEVYIAAATRNPKRETRNKNILMSAPNRFILLLVIIIALAGCSGRDSLNKVWFYTYDGTKSDADGDPADNDPELTPVHFMNLQANGQYTAYLQGFEYGTWDLDDKFIVLRGTGKKVQRILLEKIEKNEITVDLRPLNKHKSSYHFEGSDNNYEEADNPFSKANNQWRIKATHKESDQEITARLKNHFRYWEKYFDWGIKADKKSLDVRSLPGPLKMYGNGFELVPLEDWAPEWKSLFYNMEDCRIAWNKLHYFFTYERIAWAKTDHKFKMFVSAFQQMQRKIE
jgi:hypothetical protein